jgi:hypothetical protein
MMLAEVGFLQESAVQLSRNIAMRFVVRMMPNRDSAKDSFGLARHGLAEQGS